MITAGSGARRRIGRAPGRSATVGRWTASITLAEEEERALKRFLHARVYDAAPLRAVRDEAQRVLASLFAAYRADPSLLPPEWRAEAADPTATTRRIGDFIADMTDRYAIARHRELVGPVELPEGF